MHANWETFVFNTSGVCVALLKPSEVKQTNKKTFTGWKDVAAVEPGFSSSACK